MGNPANLVPFAFAKGERRVGRAAGTPNLATKVLKHAIILAGQQSRHSKDGTLLSYLIHVADEHPSLYIGLIGRLIPIEAKVKTENGPPQRLSPGMDLNQMVSAFEHKLKSGYRPHTIEHDADSDDDGDDE